jgi:flagellar M-ring protein FliF
MINYETSKTITRVIDSPISLERLSVAIIIDGILSSQSGADENAEQYIVRTDEDLKYYEDIVKKTIGFTEDRGDEISVKVMPFKEVSLAEMPDAETDYMPIIITIMKYLVPLIVAVLFLLIVVRPLIASLSRAVPQTGTRVSVSDENASLEGAMQPKEIPLEKQVVNWADNNPQQAAGLVKSWLEEK